MELACMEFWGGFYPLANPFETARVVVLEDFKRFSDLADDKIPFPKKYYFFSEP